jgi:hypothetical protein
MLLKLMFTSAPGSVGTRTWRGEGASTGIKRKRKLLTGLNVVLFMLSEYKMLDVNILNGASVIAHIKEVSRCYVRVAREY